MRAWWAYEASSYVGVSTKNFLADPVLCVMLIGVFNQYHAVLHQPLQALAIFLAEYRWVGEGEAQREGWARGSPTPSHLTPTSLSHQRTPPPHLSHPHLRRHRSGLTWLNCAVTVQGITPFMSGQGSENQPTLRDPHRCVCPLWTATRGAYPGAPTHPSPPFLPSSPTRFHPHNTPFPPVSTRFHPSSDLAGPVFMQRHQDFYHMINAPEPAADAPAGGTAAAAAAAGAADGESGASTTAAMTAPPSVSATPTGTGALSTAVTVAAAASALSSTVASGEPEQPPRTVKRIASPCFTPVSMKNFQRRLLNVVHPFTGTNMIQTTLTAEKATKIAQIFEAGAVELREALLVASGAGAAGATHALTNFFRNTLGRFEGGWRPDVFGANVHESNTKAKLGPDKVADGAPAVRGAAGGRGVLPTVEQLSDQVRRVLPYYTPILPLFDPYFTPI